METKEEVLGTEAVESPSTVTANDQSPAPTLADKYFTTELDAQASKKAEELEAISGDGEAQIDESTGSEGNVDEVSGEEEATKAEELEGNAEEKHPDEPAPEEVENEKEIVEFSELQNYSIEIGGEYYSAEDLKSILGQDKAAGTKSREASDKLKELEVREATLIEQTAALETRNQASVSSNEMLKIQAEGRDLQELIQKASADGDAYELVINKQKLEELGVRYNKAKQDVDVENSRLNDQQFANAEAGLKDQGYGYLLKDGPAAVAWNDYVGKNLSEVEAKTVAMVPSLAVALEKARKWDASIEKAGARKLKTSGKTLKTGSGKPVSSKKTKAQEDRRTRIDSGNATERDIDQTTASIKKKYFS